MKNILILFLTLATFQANAQFNNKFTIHVGAGNIPAYGFGFQHIFLSNDYNTRPLFGLATYPSFGKSNWNQFQWCVGGVVHTKNDFYVRGKVGNVWGLDGGKVVGRFAFSAGVQNLRGWKSPSNFDYIAAVTYLISESYENARNCYDRGWGQAVSVTLGVNANKDLEQIGLMFSLNVMFGE